MLVSIQRTLSVLILCMPMNAFAVDGYLGLDLGSAGNTRAHADSLAVIRTMPSTLSLTARYQLGGAAYLYPNLDYGLSGAALDSSTGSVAVGVLYHRESFQYGLDSSLLPGWKLPDQEIAQLSLHSLVGGSMAVSFYNRSLSLGMSGFYVGTSSDLDVLTHAVELNASMGAKFLDQVIVGVSMVDLLSQVDGRGVQMAARWGALDVSGPIWAKCMETSDIYYSSGGLEVDMGFRDGLDFMGVAADIPLSCNLSLRGGYQRQFQQQTNRYGIGLSLENVVSSIGYDVQLRPLQDQFEHIHLLSLTLRITNAPFEKRPHL